MKRRSQRTTQNESTCLVVTKLQCGLNIFKFNIRIRLKLTFCTLNLTLFKSALTLV